MKGMRQFGALTLAAALTITLVAPISANAAVNWTRVQTGTDSDGDKLYTYTVTNEDTGASVVLENQYDGSSNVSGATKVLTNDWKSIEICTNSYNEYVENLSTTKDVAKFANFKSNKKALKVKVMKAREYTDQSEKKYACNPDYKDKDGNGYYKNVNGEVVKVEKSKLSEDMPKGYDSGSYTVRFFTKKAGTYTVSYDAILKNGTVVKKSLKVVAKSFGWPIKDVTFNGKSIYQAVDNDSINANTLWTKGAGSNRTTAKSGKIKVTMSSNDYKLKKIEVGTPVIETKNVDGYISTNYVYNNDNNLDGHYTWKTVKNGKKIKLSTVNEAETGSNYNSKNTTYFARSFTTTTPVRITYFDKKNKTTRRETVYIYKIQK